LPPDRLAGAGCARYRTGAGGAHDVFKALAAFEGCLDMTKASSSLALAAAVALGVLSQPGAAAAQPSGYAAPRGNWMVGPGYFGFSGYPWAGPPFAWPTLKPAYGCYFTRARLQNAWRRVEVCS
jgi:hypothetical protein